MLALPIGVRDGGAGGAVAPPIRAVCRHEFGQRVDIIRAKHNRCLNNTNLGSVTAVNEKNTNLGYVTAVNGKNSATPQNMGPGKFLLLPPPHRIWIPEHFCYYPPPLNPFGQKSVCPPKWMLARTPMALPQVSVTLYQYPAEYCICRTTFITGSVHFWIKDIAAEKYPDFAKLVRKQL